MKTRVEDLTSDIASLTFEAALAELQELSRKMSEGAMPLAESVNAYSRGVALSRHCQKLLDDAKEQIRVCDQELSKVVEGTGEVGQAPRPAQQNTRATPQSNPKPRTEDNPFESFTDEDDIPF